MIELYDSAHRTRRFAACVIGLALGAGIITGSGVASADGSTVTNIGSPPTPIPIPYPNISAQTVQTLINSNINGLPGSTPGNATGPLNNLSTFVLRLTNDPTKLPKGPILGRSNDFIPLQRDARNHLQDVKDAVKKAIEQIAEINRSTRIN